MRASEVLSLARRAGIAPDIRVLDLCCGVGGPGLHVVSELGCRYLGVDSDPRSIAQARQRAVAQGLAARFEVATLPPVPAGLFDVVLLLETLLAFRDKAALLQAISSALPVGGRFAFTVEEGAPLTAREREAMPGSGTVWPVPLAELFSSVEGAGMRVVWHSECTSAHLVTVRALLGSYTAAAPEVAAAAGDGTVEDLLASHHLWSTWLREERIRKFGVIAEKAQSSPAPA
ncbi:MAG: class I SAM-dependent methyltransferase [Intrasporangiaceae bacterium]|nr:class I SAM-dependent methyltransferase [Intrasporangiaceae bacterium]